jgi:futalosine hydrolase
LVPGDLVQAREERFADLGYRDGNRFLDLDAMGFPMLARPDGDLGCRLPAEPMTTTIPAVDFLTVSQLTNSAETADALVGSFGAAVENMEGAGVALAAHQAAITFHELRAVSNLVGPRDRSAWQVREPLIRLGELIRALSAGRSPR